MLLATQAGRVQLGWKGIFMKRKQLIVLCACLISLSGINTSRASGIAAIGDVVVVRPVSFVATVLGSVFFVVALPFAAASKSTKDTANVLVVEPAEYTFTRPVGDFSSDYD
jgi:hypothetical protein